MFINDKIKQAMKKGPGDYKQFLKEIRDVVDLFSSLEISEDTTLELDKDLAKKLFSIYYILNHSISERKWTILNSIKKLSFLQNLEIDDNDVFSVMVGEKSNSSLFMFDSKTKLDSKILTQIKNDMLRIKDSVNDLYSELISSN